VPDLPGREAWPISRHGAAGEVCDEHDVPAVPAVGLIRRAPHPAVAMAASDPATALSHNAHDGEDRAPSPARSARDLSLPGRGGQASMSAATEVGTKIVAAASPLPATFNEKRPPLVVVAKIKSALRIVALDETAARLGLEPGQPLADARAMIPHLDAVARNEAADAALLAAIADWAERYTPLVALDDDGLMLDVTGSAHLFGGEAAMVTDLLARLAAQGFAAGAAIAATPGAAFAAARYAGWPVVASEETAAMLAPLPLAALRLDAETVSALDRVGLKRIGQIMEAPRGPLADRFGKALLSRLDQALGRIEEAIGPRRPVAPLIAERRFAEPIVSEEDIAATIASLAAALAETLAAREEGARLYELALFRVDGAVRRIAVGAGRPVRDPRLVLDLFREKFAGLAEEIDAGFGFDMVRLSVPVSAVLAPAQIDLAGDAAGEADLGRLIDRIGARLGPERVSRIAHGDSHLPERAEIRRQAMDDGERTTPLSSVICPPSSDLLDRPLRLFARPEPVEATAAVPDGPPVHFRWRRALYRVARAEGPERIAPEWWRDDEALTRDYFRVEDFAGHRFWLYREGLYGRETVAPRWYLHGVFA
jgi:protein ImuB